jgi:hypothetical protein
LMQARRQVLVLALAAAALATGANPWSASAQSSPGRKLLSYLWNYQNWQLRPYVTGVALSGGRTGVVEGRSRLTGATANVRSTLHDQPALEKAARAICRAARSGVRKLHLTMVSAVRVWSVDGHAVARC